MKQLSFGILLHKILCGVRGSVFGAFMVCGMGVLLDALDTSKVNATLKENGIEGKVVATEPSALAGFSFVTIEQGKFWIPLLADESGSVLLAITPNTMFSSNKAFLTKFGELAQKISTHNNQITEDMVLAVFKKNTKNILEITGDNTKKTTYMVLDINCPYCKQEVDKIEEYLKEANLKIFVVGILSMDSAKKAATFMAQLGSLGTNEQKVAYLKKAFSKDFKPNDGVETDNVISIAKALNEAGLRGVPYLIKR